MQNDTTTKTRQVRGSQPREGEAVTIGEVLKASGGIGSDVIRHLMLLAGLAVLAVIVIGATTDGNIANQFIYWFRSVLELRQ